MRGSRSLKALRNDLRNAHRLAEGLREVAGVAVISNGRLLVGRRRDSGKWTLPGGHLDPGETPHEAAKRELYEESGIQSDTLMHLDSERVISMEGDMIIVHAFRLDTYEQPTTKDLDPDDEVSVWKWVPVLGQGASPELDPRRLHSPKNVVLKYIGLLDWEPDAGNNSISQSPVRRSSPTIRRRHAIYLGR